MYIIIRLFATLLMGSRAYVFNLNEKKTTDAKARRSWIFCYGKFFMDFLRVILFAVEQWGLDSIVFSEWS